MTSKTPDAALPAPTVDRRPRVTAPSLRKRLSATFFVAQLTSLLLVAGFVGWSASAPLSSAAIAPGTISPIGSRRAIQHLEGGIVRGVLVREGDLVEAGAPVVTLDTTQARAAYLAMRSQWLRLLAVRSRLVALRNAHQGIDFPDELVAAAGNDPSLSAFIENERRLFQTTLEAVTTRDSILRQQIEQLREEVLGIEAIIKGFGNQLQLLDQEIEDLRGLVNKGLARRPTLLSLERNRAGTLGNQAANSAAVARAMQKISEIELQQLSNRTDFLDQQSKEITRINGEIAQLEERMAASRDVLSRTTIVAPATGRIVNLKIKTTTAVIRPGEVLMEVVPTEDDLVVDVRLSPNDIDVVHAGQVARVHLVPYVQRYVPPVAGTVSRIGADALTDERSGLQYYAVTVVIDRASAPALGSNIDLTPGMPVEVFIETGQRTLFEYMTEPLWRSLNRSFRES